MFEVRKNKDAHLSIKLNETKQKTASNKGASQKGYSLEH